MNWLTALISGLSALAGSILGGCMVAYRIGQWKEAVEQRLGVAEGRLRRGDAPVGKVPVIEARIDLILEELRAIKKEMREDRQNHVSHEECNRRHHDAAA